MRLCKNEKETVALRPKSLYTHVHIMSLATSWMIALLATHKILNKRRIKGLVYWTWTSVVFIGPGLLGFLGRGLCVFNVFAFTIATSCGDGFLAAIKSKKRWLAYHSFFIYLLVSSCGFLLWYIVKTMIISFSNRFFQRTMTDWQLLLESVPINQKLFQFRFQKHIVNNPYFEKTVYEHLRR